MMEILFEDNEIIAIRKEAGIAVETKRFAEEDMVLLLKNYFFETKEQAFDNPAAEPEHLKEPYVGVVHRLDQPVEGIVVFAKTQKAAAFLSRQIQTGEMKKYYLAVTQGIIQKKSGTCTDYLKSDQKTNLTRIVAKGEKNAKKAVLRYDVLKTEGDKSLVQIELITGRHHQIRAQMSHMGHPLWNDVRYGFQGERTGREIALCAYRLSFKAPSGEQINLEISPRGEAFSIAPNARR